MISRRKTLITTGSVLGSTLAGCLETSESQREIFHLELINDVSEPVSFYVIVEQDGDTDDSVVWKPFRVEEGTKSEMATGQLIPDLDIGTVLDGPLHIRVYARGARSELTLESERISWTPNRIDADRYISARLTNEEEIVVSEYLRVD